MKIFIKLLAVLMGVKVSHLDVFMVGFDDGMEQGLELTMGMTYEDLDKQDAYDAGTHLGCSFYVLKQD